MKADGFIALHTISSHRKNTLRCADFPIVRMFRECKKKKTDHETLDVPPTGFCVRACVFGVCVYASQVGSGLRKMCGTPNGRAGSWLSLIVRRTIVFEVVVACVRRRAPHRVARRRPTDAEGAYVYVFNINGLRAITITTNHDPRTRQHMRRRRGVVALASLRYVPSDLLQQRTRVV